MKINMEQLFCIMESERNAYFEYRRACEALERCTRFEDRKEKLRMQDVAFKAHEREYRIITEVISLLNLHGEQITRLNIADRAIQRWHEKTDYAFCISPELAERLERFIIG